MLWVKVKRIFRTSFIGFWRNSFVSLASVLLMTVTLFVIGLIIFSGTILNASLKELKDKVDINVYFVANAPEEGILNLKKSIEAQPGVKNVEYISNEQALANFKVRHENDQLTLQALEELGKNPLGAVLNIRAEETSQYEAISKFLENQSALSKDGNNIIDHVNYNQNKTAIDKLTKIINSAKTLGFAMIIIFAFISVLITFNTIRLVIYTSREEISVMRLVGASAMYIRGPFVVSGIMYGVIAGILTLLIFYPLVLWLGPVTENFFSGINLATYYLHNFVEIALIIIGFGIILGAISSFLAVRKYLAI